jgi:hypothetical protein
MPSHFGILQHEPHGSAASTRTAFKLAAKITVSKPLRNIEADMA